MAKYQAKQRHWREERRFRAWDLHQKGWKQVDIATALGVTEGSVSQWLTRARSNGVDALLNRTIPGAPRRLTDAQREQIPSIPARGAEPYSFHSDLWSSARVAEVIRRIFGVRYHPSHVRRLLHDLGLSVQKPAVHATQRDEAAIVQWERDRLPALKKKR